MYDFSNMAWFCPSFAYVFVSSGPKSFLLFGQKNSLSRLVPDTADCPDVVLPIHGVKNIKAVEFDPVSQYIYWVRVNLLSCTFFLIKGEQKCTAEPTEGESTPQYKKKMFVNIGLMKYGFWVMASRQLWTMCKGPTLSCHASIARARLVGPCFLPPHVTGAVYHDFL